MSNLDRLNELQESLEPTAVRRWLASEGWALTRQQKGVAETWTSAVPRGSYGIREVFLPLNKEFSDFARRYREVLSDLEMAYQVGPSEIVERIAAASSDIFFVRMQQQSIDGTIPFAQATELMGSIQRMVRAAATSASNPRHSHRGRRPAEVNEFMEEDLRFGHTKRGSFIMTVAARIPPADRPAARRETVEDDPIIPFQRRVMATLAEGLVTTKDIATSGKSFDVEEMAEKGVSLELVQSIIAAADFEGLQKVDLSFDWAEHGPTPPPFDEVSIGSSEVPALENVRQFLSKEMPVDDVTVIGRVAELSREDLGNGQEEASVIIEGDLFGRVRKIRVPLIDSDYDWAIYAHQRRLPFTVSGTPIKKQRWQLGGVVKADLTFLRSERARRND